MRKIKLVKKALAVFMVSAMACGSFPAYATNYVDNAIYIDSQAVPQEITEYAKNIFSNLYYEDIEYLGFSYTESSEMKLAPGFCANAYDNTIDASNIYYYPVMCNDDIVALFTVKDNNGIYSYQFGKDDIAISLNNINTSRDNALEIIVSNDAFYGITNDGVFVLSTQPTADQSEIATETENLAAEKQIALATDTSAEVITISTNTTYTETALASPKARTYIGKKRFVPIVDNWSYPSGDSTRGSCWASCTGSLIEYYTDGTKATVDDAKEMRTKVLEDRLADNGAYSGGISAAKKYIEKYVDDYSMTIIDTCLAWTDVKKELLNDNAPCYTRWLNDESNVGHAMVLCGYRYQDTDPNNSSYYGIYLMDPNKDSIQLVSYNSTYTINSKEYEWVKTLTVD